MVRSAASASRPTPMRKLRQCCRSTPSALRFYAAQGIGLPRLTGIEADDHGSPSCASSSSRSSWLPKPQGGLDADRDPRCRLRYAGLSHRRPRAGAGVRGRPSGDPGAEARPGALGRGRSCLPTCSFVGVDFETDDLGERLARRGLSRRQAHAVRLAGRQHVSGQAGIDRTLAFVAAKHAAKGSVIVLRLFRRGGAAHAAKRP